MTPDLKKLSNALRMLAVDAVESAGSGHPGLPLGAADIVTVLFSKFLKFDTSNPRWIDRDRFVLSAGHGSALLYSLLYLTGYKDISIDDLINFRQISSKAAGHPEYKHFAGIEVTTGPLGQGFANAVGMAISERHLNGRFGGDLIDHYTYVLVGDGCLMEGISFEAAALAGHLGLNRLICLYDSNHITIDGNTSLADSVDTKKRFESYGWTVFECDGHNYQEIENCLNKAKMVIDKPVLIICTTKIGYGAPTKQGSEACHGSPLGSEEISLLKKSLNWNSNPFTIPEDIKKAWEDVGLRGNAEYKSWKKRCESSPKKDEFKIVVEKDFAADINKILDNNELNIWNNNVKGSTRVLSGQVLEFLNKHIRRLIVGSADLAKSNSVYNKNSKVIKRGDYYGNFIHYGIREHAMAAIMNGMAVHGCIIPVGATFLVFSDYMKPAIRLSALMGIKTIYIFTHDSIYVGEDGPTHQPIEQLSGLRAIPNFNVLRPCDAIEVSECWEIALMSNNTPSALVLTRQDLPFCRTEYNKENLCKKGAYIIENTEMSPDVVLVASGSEVSLCFEIAKKLHEHGVAARIVSMPCLELFNEQSDKYKKDIFGQINAIRVFVEASDGMPFYRYIRPEIDMFFGTEHFGKSGKAKDVAEYFGLTADKIYKKIIKRKNEFDEKIWKIYNENDKKEVSDSVYSLRLK